MVQYVYRGVIGLGVCVIEISVSDRTLSQSLFGVLSVQNISYN